MARPLSVDQIAMKLMDQGDTRSVDAIRVHIIRAIESGSLEDAFKVNPNRQTSPWLVPAEKVEKWINAR